ncbi:hypothetical protein WAI453_000948 [Rhynchosporium graminicola]|uniref:NADP-dependent oxidoreductase domain-containing protein n=1 Tax=Rhynchosporium graminicola TaxID=2792576 RepID=A0A1E1K5E0_9HELO|nr:uncharacterized protein RCO7_07756 [Rhynchosporium commune]
MSYKIPLVRLNDGTTIPAFGIGITTESTDVYERVYEALLLGMFHISVIGTDHLDEIRHAVELSGVPWEVIRISVTAPEGAVLTDTIREAMRGLQRPYVDIFLMDAFSYKTPADVTIAWSLMEGFKHDKRASSIGVANMSRKDLEVIVSGNSGILPVMNLKEFHPLAYTPESVLWAQSQEIKTCSYKPYEDFERSVRVFSRTMLLSERSLLAWIRDSGVLIVSTFTTRYRLLLQLEMFDGAYDKDEFEAITALRYRGPKPAED